MQHFRWHINKLYRLAFVAFVFATLLPRASGSTNDDVRRLQAIQAKVQNVVAKVMPASVAISDGIGAGSGVIISADGLILTAAHVINESNFFEVILPSGQTVRAKALGMNLGVDAGMLQVIDNVPGGLPYVEIERDERLKVGEWVVSLGHSGGYEIGRTPPVRTGRILRKDKDQIITDAVLIGGDSGGPLFNLNGRLIGIHSSIGDSVAENRHVTIAAFDASWNRMKAGEKWGSLPELDDPTPPKRRGIMGVRLDLAARNCTIRVVNSGSSAFDAGILVGDVVVDFQGTKIRDGRHLIEVVKRYQAGDVCELTILRNSKLMKFELQLK